jgi:hypothetical protein
MGMNGASRQLLGLAKVLRQRLADQTMTILIQMPCSKLGVLEPIQIDLIVLPLQAGWEVATSSRET